MASRGHRLQNEAIQFFAFRLANDKTSNCFLARFKNHFFPQNVQLWTAILYQIDA